MTPTPTPDTAVPTVELPQPIATIFDDGYWLRNKAGPLGSDRLVIRPFKYDVYSADQMRDYAARLAAPAAQSDLNLSQERAKAHRAGYLEALSAGTARDLIALLKRGLVQIDQWQKKYGEFNRRAWLPPAGDVRWAEDVAEALEGRAAAQPPAPKEQPDSVHLTPPASEGRNTPPLTCPYSKRSNCALYDPTPDWVKLSDEIEASPPQGFAQATYEPEGEWMCPACKGSGDSGRTSRDEQNRPEPCNTCHGAGTLDYAPERSPKPPGQDEKASAAASVAALPAGEKEAPTQTAGSSGWGWQINLSADEAETLRDCIGDDETQAIVLSAGPGHDGWGLYAWSEDYPEEGAVLITTLPDPAQSKEGLTHGRQH